MTEKLIQVEVKINNVLFGICFFITIIAIAMALLEFFSRGAYPPSNINIFYVGILIIYAIHKEAIRLLRIPKTKRRSKQGEVFVYIWIIMTACLYVVNFLTENYFSQSSDGSKLDSLMNIAFTTLEVGAVFILARVFTLLMSRVLYKDEKESQKSKYSGI
jgi:hypothetical protein